jgi:hypothetical protein
MKGIINSKSQNAIEFLDFLFENKIISIINCKEVANYIGFARIEVLKWFISHGCRPTIITSEFAAKIGSIENLKYLMNIKCKLSKNIFKIACDYNKLDCAHWIYKISNQKKEKKLKILYRLTFSKIKILHNK